MAAIAAHAATGSVTVLLRVGLEIDRQEKAQENRKLPHLVAKLTAADQLTFL